MRKAEEAEKARVKAMKAAALKDGDEEPISVDDLLGEELDDEGELDFADGDEKLHTVAKGGKHDGKHDKGHAEPFLFTVGEVVVFRESAPSMAGEFATVSVVHFKAHTLDLLLTASHTVFEGVPGVHVRKATAAEKQRRTSHGDNAPSAHAIANQQKSEDLSAGDAVLLLDPSGQSLESGTVGELRFERGKMVVDVVGEAALIKSVPFDRVRPIGGGGGSPGRRRSSKPAPGTPRRGGGGGSTGSFFGGSIDRSPTSCPTGFREHVLRATFTAPRLGITIANVGGSGDGGNDGSLEGSAPVRVVQALLSNGPAQLLGVRAGDIVVDGAAALADPNRPTVLTFKRWVDPRLEEEAKRPAPLEELRFEAELWGDAGGDLEGLAVRLTGWSPTGGAKLSRSRSGEVVVGDEEDALVLEGVAAGSAAHGLGVRSGDALTAINGVPLEGPNRRRVALWAASIFPDLLRNAARPLRLSVRRSDAARLALQREVNGPSAAEELAAMAAGGDGNFRGSIDLGTGRRRSSLRAPRMNTLVGPNGGEMLDVAFLSADLGVELGPLSLSAEQLAFRPAPSPRAPFDPDAVPRGVAVRSVVPGSEAQLLGLRAGDRLHKVGGTVLPVRLAAEEAAVVLELSDRRPLMLAVERFDTKAASVAAKALAAAEVMTDEKGVATALHFSTVWLGMQTEGRLGALYVTAVEVESPAWHKGVKRGDEVTAINGVKWSGSSHVLKDTTKSGSGEDKGKKKFLETKVAARTAARERKAKEESGGFDLEEGGDEDEFKDDDEDGADDRADDGAVADDGTSVCGHRKSSGLGRTGYLFQALLDDAARPVEVTVKRPGKARKATLTAATMDARRIKAKAYKDRFVLPRYVDVVDPITSEVRKRKLAAGEYHPQSRLYPLSATLKDLSGFGVGVGMYFTTTMWFGIMLLVCGLIQLPTTLYFASPAYDGANDRDGALLASVHLIGSASCLDQERVCLDAACSAYAGEFHYPDFGAPRYSPDYDAAAQAWRDRGLKLFDDDGAERSARAVAGSSLGEAFGERLTVGLRGCDVREAFGYADLAMMVFLAAALLVLGRIQDKESEDLDLSEQTAQDYSIIVEDPNPEIVDPDEWKEWFEAKFGPVFMVTVCLNNGRLVKLFKRKRFLEKEIELETLEEEKYAAKPAANADGDGDAAASGGGKGSKRKSVVTKERNAEIVALEATQRSKSCFKRAMEALGLDPTLDYFNLELLKVNQAIDDLTSDAVFTATKVFITFNDEKSQRKCLRKLAVGLVPAWLDLKSSLEEEYHLDGNVLHVREAPEPSTVIYENLEVGWRRRAVEQLTSWAVVAIFLVVTYVTVLLCFGGGYPALGAVVISLWNSVLPEVVRVLVTMFETHHTTDQVEDSFIAKTICARAFCSAVILYLVGLEHPSSFLSPYFVGSVHSVLVADAVTSPVIRMMDLMGLLKRYVLIPIAGTEDRARAMNVGTDYLLAERYTDLVKTVFMSLFFGALFPLGYFYSAFACLVSFWVDKFCLLRVFRQKPPVGDKLTKVTRTFAACIILVHALVTAHFYYAWPFDNLCEVPGAELGPLGLQRADSLGARTDAVFEPCRAMADSSGHEGLWFLPPVRDEAWFSDDGAQQNLVFFYNIVALATLGYIFLSYFGASSGGLLYSLFFYRHKPVGAATDIPFDAVDDKEGYVPQFGVDGWPHPVLACTAPSSGGVSGGLEFEASLLSWQAAKPRTGDETEEELARDLTAAETHGLLRKANVYFDASVSALEVEVKDHELLSRAKEYIPCHTSQPFEDGTFTERGLPGMDGRGDDDDDKPASFGLGDLFSSLFSRETSEEREERLEEAREAKEAKAAAKAEKAEAAAAAKAERAEKRAAKREAAKKSATKRLPRKGDVEGSPGDILNAAIDAKKKKKKKGGEGEEEVMGEDDSDVESPAKSRIREKKEKLEREKKEKERAKAAKESGRDVGAVSASVEREANDLFKEVLTGMPMAEAHEMVDEGISEGDYDKKKGNAIKARLQVLADKKAEDNAKVAAIIAKAQADKKAAKAAGGADSSRARRGSTGAAPARKEEDADPFSL